MDLTINVENVILNIKVNVIIKTVGGVLLEKHENKSYLFLVGGRMKAGESSLEAVHREVIEETGIKLKNAKFLTVIENFFDVKEGAFQEISFLYEGELESEFVSAPGIIAIPESEIADLNIRPNIMKEILLNKSEQTNYIVKGV